MNYDIIHTWTDSLGHQHRLLLERGDQTGRLPFNDQYLVWQKPTFSRVGEPGWFDILIFPVPTNGGQNTSDFLVSILTSLGFEFPPVTL